MLAHKVDGENPAGYSESAPSHTKTGKKGGDQEPSAPKDSCNQWIECDTFSDPRELIPLMQAEGQLYFHAMSCNHWMLRVKQTPVQSRKEKERWNLWLMTRSKHQAE